jgi:hypothetical protein
MKDIIEEGLNMPEPERQTYTEAVNKAFAARARMRGAEQLLDKMAEPATGPQRHTIARLCSLLHIDSELESGNMSKGEAGVLIRQLSEAVKRRRR